MADEKVPDRKNPIVLDYHNSLLRQSDVDLLDQPNWINDSIIGFAFEYFEKEQFSHCVDLVGYISPSVTQAIKLSSNEEVCIFLDPLQLQLKHYVFMAVNDQMSANTHGGTHWSLLVYDRNIEEFHHYDSLFGSNRNVAKFLSEKLTTYFSGDNYSLFYVRNAFLSILLEEPEKCRFKEKTAPQQENGYDCGMHVIITCEHLIRTFVEACMVPLDDVTDSIPERRQNLKELIYQLKS